MPSRTALVTCASSGIGHALVARLAGATAASAAAGSRYKDTAYRDLFARMPDYVAESEASALRVECVADAVMTALTARRPRTRYPVVLNPLVNWRLLPDRVLDRVIARQQLGLMRRP